MKEEKLEERKSLKMWRLLGYVATGLTITVGIAQVILWLRQASTFNLWSIPYRIVYTFAFALLIALLSWGIQKYFSTKYQKKFDEIQKHISELPKRIALFLPRSSTNRVQTFWMEFETHLREYLAKNNCDVVTMNLSADYDEEEQVRGLENFNWEGVKGAIVAPAGDRVIETVISVMKNGTEILLHDTAPERAIEQFAKENVSVKVVSVDNKKGGEMAAEIMYDHLSRTYPNNHGFNILIVPGNKSHPHSVLRVIGFREQMKEKSHNRVTWYETEDGNWSYSQAQQSLKIFLTDHLNGGNPQEIHGLFACNDEMALAVEDLLEDMPGTALDNAVIIGFDYTGFLISEWGRNRATRIIGTIDAKIEEQARAVAESMLLLIGGQAMGTSVKIPPAKVLRRGGTP